jgi:hypothetical protein
MCCAPDMALFLYILIHSFLLAIMYFYSWILALTSGDLRIVLFPSNAIGADGSRASSLSGRRQY